MINCYDNIFLQFFYVASTFTATCFDAIDLSLRRWKSDIKYKWEKTKNELKRAKS